MPELVTSREQQLDDMTPKAQIGRGMAIAPDATFDTPTPGPAPEAETFLHPVKAFNDLINAVRENTAMTELLLKQSLKERVFVDTWAAVGANVGYSTNYHERKYVYAYSLVALTLNYSNGGSVALPANQWVNISPPRATTVTVNGGSDSSPSSILFRACDVPMPSTFSGETVIAQSTNISATNSGTCTLAAVPGKTTWIRGFMLSSPANATPVSGQWTITGVTNQLNGYITQTTSAGEPDVAVYFGEKGISASAVNTPIVLNYPALAGGAPASIIMWGYQI